MARFVLVRGLPGSGKSTVAKSFDFDGFNHFALSFVQKVCLEVRTRRLDFLLLASTLRQRRDDGTPPSFLPAKRRVYTPCT